MGSGSLVDEDEIQVVKIGEEGDEDDQGVDEDQEGEGERMEGAEQEKDVTRKVRVRKMMDKRWKS